MRLRTYLLSLLSVVMAGLLLSSTYQVLVVSAPDTTLRVHSSPNQTEVSKQLILGVLEHHTEEKKGHVVRVLFYVENGQWKSFPTDFNTEKDLSQAVRSFPEAVTWTICFDGRTLGSLASKTPPSYSLYADIGLQQITSKGSVPTVGQPSTLFSGWPGGRTYRPLVLNSRPYCGDSEKWHPEKPGQDEISAIKDHLRKTFQVPASKLSKATIKVNKSYGSQSRDEKLISLDIAKAVVIPMEGEDDQNLGAWFYVKGREVRYLGSNMLLMDIGDYDQDGHEEALFKIQRYNNDGYALHFDGFKQKVEFSWNYH